MTRTTLRYITAVPAAILLAASSVTNALEFRVNAQVQSEFESNALQSPQTEEEDIGISYGVALDFEHREASWDVGGNYQMVRVDYTEDLNQDETLFLGVSDFIWRPKPGLFEWSFTHSRQNETQSVLDPDIPDNREVRQVFTTQPVMFFRLNSGDQIITSLRYVDVSQETANNNDSRRWGGAVGWRRALTAVSDFSVNSEYNQVDFTEVEADYDMFRVFAEYSADLRVLDYSIQIGVSSIEPDVGDSLTAEYIRLEGAIEQSVHRYYLIVIDELTDTSIALTDVNFALNIDNRGTEDIQVFDGNDLLTQRQAQFNYDGNIFCRSCTVSAGLGYVDLDYETEDRREKNAIFSLGFSYAFSQRFDVTLGVDYQDRNIEGQDLGLPVQQDVNIEETTYSLTFDWQVSRRLDLSLAVLHDTQSSPVLPAADPAGEDFNLNFDNDVARLLINYRLW